MTGIARIFAATLLVLAGLYPIFAQATAGGTLTAEGHTAWWSASSSDGSEAVFQASDQADQPRKSSRPKSRQPGRLTPATPDDAGPIAVFASIESGWKSQNVKQILRHFGKNKVAISIAGAGPSGGEFSKSQSFYLLKDLFKYTITKKFEFIQYRNMNSDKKQVFAVAERYYKRTDDGRLFKDKIFVSLQKEGDHWVVDEIKSIQ